MATVRGKVTQKYMHFVCIAVAVVVVAATAYYAVSYIRKAEGFSGGGANDDYHMVMFKAAWCPHCQSALPTYQSIMAAADGEVVNGRKLYFDVIDPDQDTSKVTVTQAEKGIQIGMNTSYATSQTVSVVGYPTYFLFGPSGPIQYNGALDRDSIVGFAASH